MPRKKPKSKSKPARKTRKAGTAIIWPSGVQARYDISLVTRWRWERNRQLPPRDVFQNGVAIGWKPETLDAADRGDLPAR